jgi:hypothetical protein
MNSKKKIEQYLENAPKSAAPEGLLERLRDGITLTAADKRSVIRGWFVPDDGSVSIRRVAIAAMLTVAAILPLSYGATKAAKYVIKIFEATFEYPETVYTHTMTRSISTSGDNIQNEEDAKKAEAEFYQLYKQGKAKEIKPGIWVATLSSGEAFAYGGDPENLEWSEADKEKLRKELKEQFDEINELKKAGKYEKIYKPEHDFVIDGRKYRYFEAIYALSDGRIVTVGSSEPARD